jgi:hypothetical protein
METTTEQVNAPGVYKHHCFYWNSSLTKEEMDAIHNFLVSMTPEQRELIEKLTSDSRREGYEDGYGEGGMGDSL